MHRQSTIHRLIIFGAATLIGMWISTGVAAASPAEAGRGDDATRGNAGQTSATQDCDGTHHSKTGHGANDAEPHAYNETCDGTPSGNGVGDGAATGKPCAGCVGNADDKNPPGQYPDGSDHNAGYECDRNEGIGKTNPAHTGCTTEPADTEGDNASNACPAGDAAMTAHRYLLNGTKTVSDLTGKVKPGDHVKAFFTIAAGCPDLDVALTSYSDTDATVLFDRDTGRFGAGEHTLTVDIADCAFQVDFHLGTALVDTDEGAKRSCDGAGQPGSPLTGPPAGNGTTGGDAGALTPASGTHGNPSDAAVLGTAISAAVGNGTPASVLSSQVDVLDLTPAPATSRPAEVLGIQITRGSGSTAELARTGGPTTVPLVTIGTLLCLVGLALTSGRGRRETTVVVS